MWSTICDVIKLNKIKRVATKMKKGFISPIRVYRLPNNVWMIYIFNYEIFIGNRR